MPQTRSKTGPRAGSLPGRCIDRLEEYPPNLRKLRSRRRLALSYGLDEVAAGQCRIHSRLYGKEEVLAVLHRHELPKLDDPGLRLDELADRATQPGRRAFANQQALCFDSEPGGYKHQQCADSDASEGVIERIAGRDRREQRGQSQAQSGDRRQIFAQYHDQFAAARFAKPAPKAMLSPNFADLLQQHAQRNSLREHREQHDGYCDPWRGDVGRIPELLDSFEYGKYAAYAEQEYRNDEGPEVRCATMAERVLCGRRCACLLAAKQKQRFVTRVGERVEALRQQRAGTRQRRTQKFHDGYRDVGTESVEDRTKRIGLRTREGGHTVRANRVLMRAE